MDAMWINHTVEAFIHKFPFYIKSYLNRQIRLKAMLVNPYWNCPTRISFNADFSTNLLYIRYLECTRVCTPVNRCSTFACVGLNQLCESVIIDYVVVAGLINTRNFNGLVRIPFTISDISTAWSPMICNLEYYIYL